MSTDRQRAEKAAWRAMSEYIRERDDYTCITCGKKADGHEMHAGHLISRNYKILKYDYRNVNAQCAACNTYRSGEIALYTKKFEKMHGTKLLEFFLSVRMIPKKRTVEQLKKIKNFYKMKLSELKTKKTL